MARDTARRDGAAVGRLHPVPAGGEFRVDTDTIGLRYVPAAAVDARRRFVVAARGITAGCGGGLDCRTGPVTRGQMALFLTG